MRGIRRDPGEERSGRFRLTHPRDRLPKEHIGTVTLGCLEDAVVADDRVDVIVAGCVATASRVRLADPAGAVDEDFVEAALAGLVGVLVAEVPLAEDAVAIHGALEFLRGRDGFQAQPFPFEDGVRDPVVKLVSAGQERRARRRAGWADVEIGESNLAGMESIEVRRLQMWIAVAGEIAVTLIIGQNHDDVRKRFGRASQAGSNRDRQE